MENFKNMQVNKLQAINHKNDIITEKKLMRGVISPPRPSKSVQEPLINEEEHYQSIIHNLKIE